MPTVRKETEQSTLECKALMRISNQVDKKRLRGENTTLAKKTICWFLKLLI